MACEEVVSFLQGRFSHKEYPSYHIVQITNDHLQPLKDDRHRKTFKKITGSSLFGETIFTPRWATFRSSQRLCVFNLCKHVPGSCELFDEYEITVGELNPFCLRSDVEVPVTNVGNQDNTGFIIPNSYVAVRPESKPDVFWVF